MIDDNTKEEALTRIAKLGQEYDRQNANRHYEELFQAAWQLLIEIDEYFENPDVTWREGIDPGPIAAGHLRELLSTSNKRENLE